MAGKVRVAEEEAATFKKNWDDVKTDLSEALETSRWAKVTLQEWTEKGSQGRERCTRGRSHADREGGPAEKE